MGSTAGWLGLPEDERKQHRKHAKPVNFGRLYGQGPTVSSPRRGVRPHPRPGHGEGVDRALRRPIPTSRAGAGPLRGLRAQRPHPDGREGGHVHEIHWNADGYRYTQCLNLPIQGACADAFMLALATVDATLFEAGIEGGPVAAPHDEIVLEVPEADAARAADLLREAMTAAFAATFPGAPLRDLVAVKIGRSWAETK